MGSVADTSTADPRRDPRRWRALILLCAAQFMVVLDASIVNVALPSLKNALPSVWRSSPPSPPRARATS